MEKFTVQKEMSFDSAHRLINGYRGKCSNIHGHTWRIRVRTSSGKLNNYGFVIDYSDFKLLKTWIDDNLDHGIIICKNDIDMILFCEKFKQKHFIVEGNPTSELLCKVIFEKAKELGFEPTAVEIDETCTSRATYEII